MKAVFFQGPFDVAVQDVPDPRIDGPPDAIIRVTTANICGSDLHPYEGRAPLDEGMVLGHENMGVVVKTGQGVERISVGDRVSVPFNVSCGTCRNCNDGWTNARMRANPSGKPTAGYGYPQMGPYRGGQADYLRVPWADFNLLRLPAGSDYERDFAMLSDIFPTGYHATELARCAARRGCSWWTRRPIGWSWPRKWAPPVSTSRRSTPPRARSRGPRRDHLSRAAPRPGAAGGGCRARADQPGEDPGGECPGRTRLRLRAGGGPFGVPGRRWSVRGEVEHLGQAQGPSSGVG
ncbi:alcohol dehydrogenase catalytic domain-containing protein [Streptomyces sp. NPDC002467]|uniref:alcohol dehydrogenase catalytic domain-containing protein n=1 Tax=Streptomyces sp. NPDC002467 TaxID=3364647 RepID=UPI0036C8F152